MQKNTFRLFWRYAKTYRWRLAAALLFPVLAVTANSLLSPYVLSQIINRIQAGGVTLENTGNLIITYAVLQVVGEVILWRIALFATWTFEVNSQRDLSVDIFDKLSNESLGFHANRFGGSLVSQSTKLVGAFERFWDTIIWQLLPVITAIGSIVIFTSFIYWQYSLFILVMTIIFAVSIYKGSTFMRELNKKEAQASTKLSGFLADMVTNVTAVKAYGNEKNEYKKHFSRANEWRGTSLDTMKGFLKISTGYSLLISVVTVGALIVAVYASEKNLIAIGTVYLLLTYTLNASRQMWEMNGIMRNYNRIMGDSYDMVEILAKPYDLVDKRAAALTTTKGAIEFDGVSFIHDNGEGEQVFDNFSVTIKPGERVGLVGHSGSGKTTFTRVLLRFSDIQKGQIRIDGQDIADVTQESLRRSIAYVPQESTLFHRTLGENISYGKASATKNEVIQAAKLANAWEFIRQLPQGFETLVGERGIKLSGGQRQRIAIARAILKDAPILLLDEATSALDSESEKLIQASLDNLMKDRTSIVIAHRLSTIAKLDRILVLEKGRIVEDGSHAALIKKNGVYAKLWNHQSGGFIEE
jgi:ATP-binding cassette subfamily B protein